MAISAAPPLPGRRTLGASVGADHGRVDVAEAVDLRAAQEADLDPAVLQQALEHVRHAADHERPGHQGRVADRDRQPLGLGADRAGLVDQQEPRRVGGPRQVAGQVRQPDADEDDLAVAQLPRGDGGHHLGGGVGRSRAAAQRPRRQYP